MIGQDVILLRSTLEEVGNSHPITQVCTDNITTTGVANYKMKQQPSRAMNMWYFLIRNQKPLKTFSFHGNQYKKILQSILRSITLQNIINVYILSNYRHKKRHRRSRSSYLSRPCKGVLIQKIPIWKNSARHSPFTEYWISEVCPPLERASFEGVNDPLVGLWYIRDMG